MGYRIESKIGTAFRIWSTDKLVQILTKGFYVDKDRLMNQGEPSALDEFRKTAREIRTSIRNSYREVLSLCTLCSDYDGKSETARNFFMAMERDVVAINFSERFAGPVERGEKRQTIRRSKKCEAGAALQIYTGQRTKACRKLLDAVCKDVTYVGLTERGVTLGTTVDRFPRDIDEFARLDGFKDYADMWKWFSERYETNSFTGYIIRW